MENTTQPKDNYKKSKFRLFKYKTIHSDTSRSVTKERKKSKSRASSLQKYRIKASILKGSREQNTNKKKRPISHHKRTVSFTKAERRKRREKLSKTDFQIKEIFGKDNFSEEYKNYLGRRKKRNSIDSGIMKSNKNRKRVVSAVNGRRKSFFKKVFHRKKTLDERKQLRDKTGQEEENSGETYSLFSNSNYRDVKDVKLEKEVSLKVYHTRTSNETKRAASGKKSSTGKSEVQLKHLMNYFHKFGKTELKQANNTPNLFKIIQRIRFGKKTVEKQKEDSHRLTKLQHLVDKSRLKKLRFKVRKILALRVAYCYKFIQKNYQNRYMLLQLKRKDIVDLDSKELRAEKNYLKRMEDKYGKKQSFFLRGDIIDGLKTKFEFTATLGKYIERAQIIFLQQSELKMFKNSFIFLNAVFNHNHPQNEIPSLLTLDYQTDQICSLNLVNIHFDTFSLNFEEASIQILDLINQNLEMAIKVLKLKYYKSDIRKLENFLVRLLKTFKLRIKSSDISSCSSKEYFNENLDSMIDQMRDKMMNRIDFGLLDLKFAAIFSKFYQLNENKEKAYYILKKAFLNNIESVEAYVEIFSKNKRIRQLVNQFIGKSKYENWETAIDKRKPLSNWVQFFKIEELRAPFFKNFLKRLGKIFTFKDIKELVEGLGDMAARQKAYNQSLEFYEIAIYLHEVEEKFSIINKIEKSLLSKSERIILILELNKKMYLLKTKIMTITLKNANYEIFYYYLVLCLFIYNNSIWLINDTDPAKYTQKNVNLFIENAKLYSKKLKSKNDYKKYIMFFNNQLKTTMALYSQMWVMLEKRKDKIENILFMQIKNVKDDIEKFKYFTRLEFIPYIKIVNDNYFTERKITRYNLHSYQRDYLGIFDFNDVERYISDKVSRMRAVFKTHEIEVKKLVQDKVKPAIRNLVEKLTIKAAKYRKKVRINTDMVKKYFSHNNVSDKLLGEVLLHTIYMGHYRFCLKRDVESKLIMNAIKEAETFEEYFARAMTYLTSGQLEKFNKIISLCKARLKESIQEKKIQKKDITKEPKKKIGEIFPHLSIKSQKQPDLEIGFYLRLHTPRQAFKKKFTKFYLKKKKEISDLSERLNLMLYGEGRRIHRRKVSSFASEAINKKTKKRFTRKSSCDDNNLGIWEENITINTKLSEMMRKQVRHKRKKIAKEDVTSIDGSLKNSKEKAMNEDYEEIWKLFPKVMMTPAMKQDEHLWSIRNRQNINQDSKIFFEIRSMKTKRIFKKIEIKRNIIFRQDTIKIEGNLLDSVKGSPIKSNRSNAQDFNISPLGTGEMRKRKRLYRELDVDSSLNLINKLNFRLEFFSSQNLKFFDFKFRLSQKRIGFVIYFDDHCKYHSSKNYVYSYLDLEQDLWILKEKFNLDNNKRGGGEQTNSRIKTYFPLLHDLLSNRFFKKIFNSYKEDSKILNEKDLTFLHRFKDPMALKYPILMTKLKAYDELILDKLKFDPQARKDLDALQCLIEIIFFYAKIFSLFNIGSPVGKCNFKKIHMNKIYNENSHITKLLRRLNYAFLLQKKITEYQKKFKKEVFSYFHLVNFNDQLTSPVHQIDYTKAYLMTEIILLKPTIKKNFSPGKSTKFFKRPCQNCRSIDNHVIRAVLESFKEKVYIASGLGKYASTKRVYEKGSTISDKVNNIQKSPKFRKRLRNKILKLGSGFSQLTQNLLKKVLKFHVARSLFLDEHKQFYFLDMQIELNMINLEEDLWSLEKLISGVEKVCENSETKFSKEQYYLLVMILILNRFVKFKFDIDSKFRQIWLKVYSKMTKSSQEKLKMNLEKKRSKINEKRAKQGKKLINESRVKRLIIKTSSWKIQDTSRQYLTFIEFLMIYHLFNKEKTNPDDLRNVNEKRRDIYKREKIPSSKRARFVSSENSPHYPKYLLDKYKKNIDETFSLLNEVGNNWNSLYRLIFQMCENPFEQNFYKIINQKMARIVSSPGFMLLDRTSSFKKFIKIEKLILSNFKNNKGQRKVLDKDSEIKTVEECIYKFGYKRFRKIIKRKLDDLRYELLEVSGVKNIILEDGLSSDSRININFMNISSKLLEKLKFVDKVVEKNEQVGFGNFEKTKILIDKIDRIYESDVKRRENDHYEVEKIKDPLNGDGEDLASKVKEKNFYKQRLQNHFDKHFKEAYKINPKHTQNRQTGNLSTIENVYLEEKIKEGEIVMNTMDGINLKELLFIKKNFRTGAKKVSLIT